MNDTISADTSGAPETTEPSPSVHALDRLVGTWRVSGGAEGSVRFEWMEGGHFCSPDGRTLAGAWTYPGGGGYEYTITRVDGELEGVAARGGQNPWYGVSGVGCRRGCGR